MRYEEFLDYIECFRRGGLKVGRRVLIVHLLARGSQVKYYIGSHLHDLETIKRRRSLYEISLSKLARVGSKPKEKQFLDSGM